MYFCGWDGGGTKTEVLITDEQNHMLNRIQFGPLNPHGNDKNKVAKTIADCVEFMSKQNGGLAACRGLVAGTAGEDNPDTVNFITEHIRKNGYTGNLKIAGDQETALEGALDGECGAILIAGTGSICYGKNSEGKEFRTGGFGYIVDDEGSGFAIGRDILIAVTRVFDGRCKKTILKDMVFEQLNIYKPSELLSWLYSSHTPKNQIADLAPLLNKAIEGNDTVAKKIAGNAAKGLSDLAVTAWRSSGMTAGSIAFLGGVFTHSEYIRNGTKELIHEALPEVNIIPPKHNPAYGAASMARKNFG